MESDRRRCRRDRVEIYFALKILTMENEPIHSSQMPERPAPDTKNYLTGFLKILPLVQWIVVIITAIGVFAIGFRDTQTVQSQTLRDVQKDYDNLSRTVQNNRADREKQLEELKMRIVTKDIFEERTRAIQEEQLRQRGMLERILEQNRISLNTQ